MPDNTHETAGGPETASPVCIHTNQIVDSCLDKDCIEDLRVYLTTSSQAALDAATGAKTRCAELLFTNVELESLAYKRGYYAVDLTFYYRIIGDALTGTLRPTTICGLAVFTKRVVLYGGKGAAKIFRSGETVPALDALLHCNCPEAIVEALDPMILSSCVKEVCECRMSETEIIDLPEGIVESFGEALVLTGERKRLYVSIGQFSTVRLERDTQLSIPACEYCAPTRECCDEECCEEDPCELFSRIDFPMRAFFPERKGRCDEATPCAGCSTCNC